MRRSNGKPPERRSSGGIRCQPLARPASSSSKAKAHSPFRFVHSERRNWGRGYSGRGTVPVSPLPEMVDLRADVVVVDPSYPLHRLLGEGWHSCGGHIVLDLLGTLRAGDSAGDRGVHQDPAQSQLRQRIPLWHQFLQLLRGPQAGLEVHAGEGLAPVEGLTLAVEVAVIVGGELALGAHLPGEEAARERDTGEDAYVPFLRKRKELLGGFLAEDVKDNLDGLHTGIVERHPRLLDLLDADPVVLYLPCLLQTIQRLEGLVLPVGLGRRAM